VPLEGEAAEVVERVDFLTPPSTRSGAQMKNARALIEEIYSAFNRRDIDGALARMSPSVNWPKASEGGRAIGKEEIGVYWTRQWKEFDPHVEPIEVIDLNNGKVEVKVRQLVKTLSGDVLSDQVLMHVYTLENGLIERMDIGESEPGFGQKHST
jgi:hypothetical protein